MAPPGRVKFARDLSAFETEIVKCSKLTPSERVCCFNHITKITKVYKVILETCQAQLATTQIVERTYDQIIKACLGERSLVQYSPSQFVKPMIQPDENGIFFVGIGPDRKEALVISREEVNKDPEASLILQTYLSAIENIFAQHHKYHTPVFKPAFADARPSWDELHGH